MEVINESLSQTLWRTINTSVTTMLALLALFFLGGELIHNFAIALMIGVAIGTILYLRAYGNAGDECGSRGSSGAGRASW